MEPFATARLLAAIGGLLIIAGVASKVSDRLGVPALVLFLLVGMAAGSEGAGCVIALLLRGDEVRAPRGDTQLLPGDHVCLFVTRDQRSFVELLFGREESEPA